MAQDHRGQVYQRCNTSFTPTLRAIEGQVYQRCNTSFTPMLRAIEGQVYPSPSCYYEYG